MDSMIATESNSSQLPEAEYISAQERAALLSQRPGFTIWFTGLSAAGKASVLLSHLERYTTN